MIKKKNFLFALKFSFCTYINQFNFSVINTGNINVQILCLQEKTIYLNGKLSLIKSYADEGAMLQINKTKKILFYKVMAGILHLVTVAKLLKNLDSTFWPWHWRDSNPPCSNHGLTFTQKMSLGTTYFSANTTFVHLALQSYRFLFMNYMTDVPNRHKFSSCSNITQWLA